MPDWQERISRHAAPAIRVEHELRYAAAAAAIRESAVWCDLGCGTGLAAAAALGGAHEGTAVLVDRDEATTTQATEAIAARELVPLAADLASESGVAQVRERLLALASDGARCVTCFETIEHLTSFAPLVTLLVELAEQGWTVVVSVPNDAYMAVENPHHATTWGEGAVAELRSLLPADHVVAHQVALQGSALVHEGRSTEEVASVALSDGVPTHVLLAFGPGAGTLGSAPRVVQADLAEQRRWERQRESDLAYAEARLRELEATRTPSAPDPAPGAGGDAA